MFATVLYLIPCVFASMTKPTEKEFVTEFRTKNLQWNEDFEKQARRVAHAMKHAYWAGSKKEQDFLDAFTQMKIEIQRSKLNRELLKFEEDGALPEKFVAMLDAVFDLKPNGEANVAEVNQRLKAVGKSADESLRRYLSHTYDQGKISRYREDLSKQMDLVKKAVMDESNRIEGAAENLKDLLRKYIDMDIAYNTDEWLPENKATIVASSIMVGSAGIIGAINWLLAKKSATQ